MAALVLARRFREAERSRFLIITLLARTQKTGKPIKVKSTAKAVKIKQSVEATPTAAPHRPLKVDPKQTFSFSVRGLKKHYEITPIIFATSIVLGMVGFMIYRGATKSDVMIDRTKDLPPWERVDLNKKDNVDKIFVANQRYHGLPELKKLKKELNDAEGKSDGKK